MKWVLGIFVCAIGIMLLGQNINIPDPNFKDFCVDNYDLSGDGEVSLIEAQGVNFMNCSGNDITSLIGVEAFVDLIALRCSFNNLTTLPVLPDSITLIECNSNQLETLNDLPSNLFSLYCYNNQLTNLPELPDSLNYLYCFSNHLTSLPELPTSLVHLVCYRNQLTSLPILPVRLEKLDCYRNRLEVLPEFPTSLRVIDCSFNRLTFLPELPINIGDLSCSTNNLIALPVLPDSLGSLYCSSNKLTSLPNLPTNLYFLECQFNQLTTLPDLPSNNLNNVICHNNQLTELPTLSSIPNLFRLDCSNNRITNLPNLPMNLWWVKCNNNQITNLTEQTPNLAVLYIWKNFLEETSCPQLDGYDLRNYQQGNPIPTLGPELPTWPNPNTIQGLIPLVDQENYNLDCGPNDIQMEAFKDNFNALLISRSITGDYINMAYDGGTNSFTYLGVTFHRDNGGFNGVPIDSDQALYDKAKDVAAEERVGEDPDNDGADNNLEKAVGTDTFLYDW